ncbi:MAG TPA: dTDP-4-dehydrorhamnose reductase [Pyrinomonadaceae bacterium]
MHSTSDKPVLVTGAGGQLGRALTRILGGRSLFLDRARLDLSEPSEIESALAGVDPSAVINAAAYTQVDRAEEEQLLAVRVNSEAPGRLARWCAGRAVPFIHISTDYVFSGEGARPWTEDDNASPVNFYGQTKLEGERRVIDAGGRFLIFRTSWVYDAAGRNFLTTMLRLGRERETLSVVKDQWGAPTYAPQLASAVLEALESALGFDTFPSGIYHLCHAGETNWHEFAEEIFAAARGKGIKLKVREVLPVTTAEYRTIAKRPLNSRLNTEKARRTLGLTMPHWSEGLARCMELIS